MPAEWDINHWPSCGRHVFLSHCQEDRNELVIPVFEELKKHGIIGWIDRHHYPAGRDAFETLREELLRSRHAVYFVTPAALQQGRGWMHIERALAATIQQRLRYGDEIAHVEMPLMFVPGTDPVFLRSTWRSLIDKAVACPHPPIRSHWIKSLLTRQIVRHEWKPTHIEWAVAQIVKFVRAEEIWSGDMATRMLQDKKMAERFSGDINLLDRVLARSPRTLIP